MFGCYADEAPRDGMHSAWRGQQTLAASGECPKKKKSRLFGRLCCNRLTVLQGSGEEGTRLELFLAGVAENLELLNFLSQPRSRNAKHRAAIV